MEDLCQNVQQSLKLVLTYNMEDLCQNVQQSLEWVLTYEKNNWILVEGVTAASRTPMRDMNWDDKTSSSVFNVKEKRAINAVEKVKKFWYNYSNIEIEGLVVVNFLAFMEFLFTCRPMPRN